MPELPEVETIARTLREGKPALIGRLIEMVDVNWNRSIAQPVVDLFVARLLGCRVSSVQRHGKVLIINLAANTATQNEREMSLLVHLRMSGRLDIVPQSQARTPHARVILWLDDGFALRFDDTRKFGRMWLVNDANEVIGDLGPDALTVSADLFFERLKDKKTAIKPLLLDQKFIAGVGNIYADESLYRAKLHPHRPANTLTQPEIELLHKTVLAVLQEGIYANGASFDWVYPGGHFQDNFRVYGQAGKPCPNCGHPIQRIVVGQRSTHFCPSCQKL